MGVVTRTDSKYFWLTLERKGQRPIREATRILARASSPQQAKENRRLAEQIYSIRMSELARGRHGLTDRPSITFTAYADWYRDHVSIHKRAHEREKSMLRTAVRFFGKTPLQFVDRPLVQEYLTKRRRTVKPATVNRELDVLKHLLASAVPQYLEASPLVGMKRLRARSGAIRVLSRGEERRLLKVADAELGAFLVLALTTLMRLGDLVSLKWAHIRATHIEVVDPKTAPYKAVLATRARRALKRLPRSAPWVFPGFHAGKGARAAENSLIRAFVTACETADVPYGRAVGGVTVHSLRHTGATRAIAAGHSLRAVQLLGGWSDIRSVMRYTHPADRELAAAAESI